MSKKPATPVTVVVAEFSTDDAAKAALKQLTSFGKDIGLHDAAIVRRDGKKVHVKETKDMGGGTGALIGGILGVFTGGISILAGAVIGGIAAKEVDRGMSNKELQAVGAALPDGSDAVLAVVDQASSDKVTGMLKKAGATATTFNLDAETVARLTAPPETATPAAPVKDAPAPATPAAPVKDAPAAAGKTK